MPCEKKRTGEPHIKNLLKRCAAVALKRCEAEVFRAKKREGQR
jgi:hypothetical protein